MPRCARLRRFGLACLLLSTLPGVVAAQYRPDDAVRQRRRVLAAKSVIRSVTVSGQQRFSDKEIRKRMHSKVSSQFDFIPGWPSRRLRRDSDRLDSLALHNWYHSQGYLDVQLELDYAFIDTTQRTAAVHVTVSEGTQTLLAGVTMEAPDQPVNRAIEPAMERFELDRPFNPFLLQQIQFDIKEAYANTGYPYAVVTADTTFTFNRRQVRIALRCDPGPPVRFGAITLPELKWTKEKAVRRELTFRSGSTYSREALIKSEEWLYLSGLFDYVALEAVTGSLLVDTTPAFRIRGVERKPLFINARTGLRQDLQFNMIWGTQVEVGDRNFTGRGRQLRVFALADIITEAEDDPFSLRLVPSRFRFAGAFTEPWPVGLRLPTTLEIAYEPPIPDPLRPYTIQRWQGLMTLLKRWSLKNQAWLRFEYEKVDIFDVDPDAAERFKADSGLQATSSITLGMRRDGRDAPLAPTRGSLTFGALKYAGGFLGGDNDYIQLEGSWSRYYRREASVNTVAHRLLLGYLQATRDDLRVPSQELYFLGGANTVRGFRENSLGPRDSLGDPIGGQFLIVGNLELRRPLLGRLWMSLFVDIGNLWNRINDFKMTEWNVGAGIGLQFMSPVGPLRVDYARRVIRVDEEPGGQLHLSIGYAF